MIDFKKTNIEMYLREGLSWTKVNIGSDNSLVPSDNKSLSDPVLVRFYDAVCSHQKKKELRVKEKN